MLMTTVVFINMPVQMEVVLDVEIARQKLSRQGRRVTENLTP